jgi:soluble lytic murein transglycosylase
MISRFALLLFIFLLFLSVPASGINILQLPDDSLNTAALKMIGKDYSGALEAARSASEGGMKEFLAGMASARMEEWETSADYLGEAAVKFPLLADYALYNRAFALYKLARYPESMTVLETLFKHYPDTPLIRSADKLLADLQYDSGNFQGAVDSYQKFIEKYPPGTDSLTALHRAALCRERLGDTTGSVATLRKILLNYPASVISEKAEEDLQRLKDQGVVITPFSPEEKEHRGTVLYDLGKYEKAIKIFDSISLEKETERFICRLILKTGKANFKARHYREAEKTFAGLISRKTGKEIGDDARFWLAKCLDKNGKGEDAFSVYMKLADDAPDSPLADDALLAAAFIRKYQNKTDGELVVLKRLLARYPRSTQTNTAIWEIAWQSYLNGDLKTAAEYFKRGLDDSKIRERTLYWYGRTLQAAGDDKGAGNDFACLLAEYPMGYYALLYKREAKVKDNETVFLSEEPRKILPLPDGFERVKALIAMGLYQEAVMELSYTRKKYADNHSNVPGIARLYLEMGDYHRAFSLVKQDQLRNMDNSSLVEWGIQYPLAFRELVNENAVRYNIPDSLVYSIMRAESSFFPTALSPVGAVGLMQIMPATAAAVANGNGEKSPSDRLTQPELNIRLGVKHLKDLLTQYNGDFVIAVAAYNAGSGNVNRWLEMFGKIPSDVFIENIPYSETREYVKKVLAGSEIYKRLYRISSPPDINRATTVPAGKDIPITRPPAVDGGKSPSFRTFS